MKINPVQGTPTIAQPSATGLSPDKIARIKAIAQNQTPETPEELNLGAIALTDTPTSATQRITMNTNRNTEQPIVQENAPLVEPVAEAVPEPVASPDTSVQAKPQPGATGSVSPELAQLAKERRALQLEREQLAKEKEALKNPPEGYVPVKDLQTSALSVLQKHGITYEQLTNEILGQQGNNEIYSLKQEIESLKKGIDEKFSAKDTQQEEAVYNYMRQEVDKMSNLQPYRFIRENKAQDKVMELVKRSWREEGEILTEEEAMNLIESELREDARRYAKLIGELERPETPVVEKPQETAKPKTLTNKDSARPVMSRRQRAIAAALGQK
jgi:hypothetical protein